MTIEYTINIDDDAPWRHQHIDVVNPMPQQPDLYADTTKYEYCVTYVDKDPKTFTKRHYTSRWGDIYQLQNWIANVIPTKVEVRKTDDTTEVQPG
jgi:hypothetical protein